MGLCPDPARRIVWLTRSVGRASGRHAPGAAAFKHSETVEVRMYATKNDIPESARTSSSRCSTRGSPTPSTCRRSASRSSKPSPLKRASRRAAGARKNMTTPASQASAGPLPVAPSTASRTSLAPSSSKTRRSTPAETVNANYRRHAPGAGRDRRRERRRASRPVCCSSPTWTGRPRWHHPGGCHRS